MRKSWRLRDTRPKSEHETCGSFGHPPTLLLEKECNVIRQFPVPASIAACNSRVVACDFRRLNSTQVPSLLLPTRHGSSMTSPCGSCPPKTTYFNSSIFLVSVY